MAANRMTPTMIAIVQDLRRSGFALEVHERTDGGYAIMLPIDGNYFDLEAALNQFLASPSSAHQRFSTYSHNHF
jgi:hypothetical protein